MIVSDELFVSCFVFIPYKGVFWKHQILENVTSIGIIIWFVYIVQ